MRYPHNPRFFDTAIAPRANFIPFHPMRDNATEDGCVYIVVKSLFKKHPEIRTILELGCGIGLFVDFIMKDQIPQYDRNGERYSHNVPDGVKAYGIDLRDIYQFDGSRSRFLVGDALHIPFKDASLDLVRERHMFNEFFDLIPGFYPVEFKFDPTERIHNILADVKRVLKDNGRLLTSLDTHSSYREDILKILSDTGFEMKEVIQDFNYGTDWIEGKPNPKRLEHILFQKN